MINKFKILPDKSGLGIKITEYTGNDAVCIIPDYIEEKCVAGIEKFAFSEHRELERVELPRMLKSIGAHAFYNCRAIRELVLGDNISDIGDGAFKNCQNVKKITVFRQNNNTKTLKGILAEFNNEIEVEIHYEDGIARLIFPYYLHNYEEDTPARIINEVTAGAGVHYRESIGSEDVRYAEYDGLFDAGMYIDVQDSSWKIAMRRITYPYNLSERARDKYKTFLVENRMLLVAQLVRDEQLEELKNLLALDLLDREDLRKCIEEARESSHMEGLGILLACQKEKYGAVRKKFEL